MRTSYSAIETYRQCPQKFKFAVIDKIKAPKSVELVFGTTVHDALEFMFSRNPLYPTLDEVLMRFSEVWRASAPKVFPELTLEHQATYEESGKSLIKQFFKKNPPWQYTVLDLESRFEILIPDPEQGKTHVLAGIIDRIDKIGEGEYEIIDYKTNRKLPTQDAVNANLQLSLYHMAVLRKWPELTAENIRLSLYFLKHNEKLSSTRTAEDLVATSGAILDVIRSIEVATLSGDFPPQVSPLCASCPYKKICPAWRHMYKNEDATPPPPDEKELEAALKEYFLIKATEKKESGRLKELQGTIKSYMDTHKVDRVFDERGYYISKRANKRFAYDMEMVKDIFTKNGLEKEWQLLLEADEKKLKIIAKSLPPHVRLAIEKAEHLTKEFVTLVASSKPEKK
jgi:RecB family exonuclease